MEKFGGKNATLADVRALNSWLCRVAEVDELSKLCVCDVSIYKEYNNIMELFIESSKTDQLRHGATVVIARTRSRLCPVAMLEWYLHAASVELGASEQFLFRGIVHSKNGMRLREKGGLSYTTVHEMVLDMFQAIGLDEKQYGLHSLRAGGATAAANADVPDRMFKRHGRWRSENVKDGYVANSLHSRLQVSKVIGH